MKKILLVSDQFILIMGIGSFLEMSFTDIEIETTPNRNEAIDKLLSSNYQLVIITVDHLLVELAEEILKLYPMQPILIYGSNFSFPVVRALYMKGIFGVLSLTAQLQQIQEAVKQVLAKQIYMEEIFKQYLVSVADPVSNKQNIKLTTREKEIVLLMLKGHKLSEICKTLNLKISTVGTFKAKIYKKLGVNNLIELAEVMSSYAESE